MAKHKKKNWLLYGYLLLSVYLFSVAMYIEVLNHKAGGYLPRRDEYRNDDPAQGLVDWRWHPPADLLERVTAAENQLNNALTTVPKKERIERKRLAQANNQLHRAVINLGLPQYPLFYISGVLYLACLVVLPIIKLKSNLLWTSTGLVLNLIAFVLLIHRNYLGSLGL